MFYPAITTAALFTAIIIHDAMVKESSSIPIHAFLGLISVLAMLYLSMKGANFVAWGILVLPMFIIALSFVLVYIGTKATVSSKVNYVASPAASSSTTRGGASPAANSAASLAGPASPASPSCNCGSSVNLPVSTGTPSSTVVTPTTNCAVHV
jgi:hypothetical protein